jgi:uncharacterized repeat protein (TIGR01451 family)
VPGDTVQYRIDYNNSGPVPATSLSILDVLDNNLSYVTGSGVPAPTSAPGAGTFGGTINWTGLGPVNPGGSGFVTFSAVISSTVLKGTTIANSASSTNLQSSTPVVSNSVNFIPYIASLVLKEVVTVPNPAVDHTEIIFNLTVPAQITMRFYTISGEPIRVIQPAEVTTLLQPPPSTTHSGDNRMLWDCKNNKDQVVASGVYFYRVEAESAAGEKAFYISKLAVLR